MISGDKTSYFTVEPLRGSLYGFPKRITHEQFYRKGFMRALMLESGYPEKDIDFCLYFMKYYDSTFG